MDSGSRAAFTDLQIMCCAGTTKFIATSSTTSDAGPSHVSRLAIAA